MKQFFAGVVKFLVILAVIGATVYAAVRYWDCIVTLVGRVKSLVTSKCCCAAEVDDYEDWAE